LLVLSLTGFDLQRTSLLNKCGFDPIGGREPQVGTSVSRHNRQAELAELHGLRSLAQDGDALAPDELAASLRLISLRGTAEEWRTRKAAPLARSSRLRGQCKTVWR
jgi:hypothetical protein